MATSPSRLSASLINRFYIVFLIFPLVTLGVTGVEPAGSEDICFTDKPRAVRDYTPVY